MIQTSALSLDDVKAILEASSSHAKANGWNVSIAVVDAGGHMLGFYRMDKAAPMSAHVSFEKAKTAALGAKETKIFEEMINKGRTAFVSPAPAISGLLEGGVNIVKDGYTIGAVGVSGVQAAQDAETAAAGIQSLKI